MGGPVPALESQAAACATRLQAADAVLVVSHIDADGLTSAAIATRALERAGIPVETAFADQLDAAVLERVAETEHGTVLFTDFGSGQLEELAPYVEAGAFTPVVVDHHQPAAGEIEYHLNPLLVGIDGASELSGAGAAYVVARALGEDNRDLAGLAVVGAVGDMQASGGALVGANEQIVEEGVAAGVLATGRDLSLYGKQTRPLPKLFEYASELSIPGISNDAAGAVRFLNELEIDLKTDGEWRTWVDLDVSERRTVVSALVQLAVERGVPASKINSIVGTTYELLDEPEGTELRDVSEYSTLLNATARYERPDVGIAVCLGNRDRALERAHRLLVNHRRNLSEGLELIQETGVEQTEVLQWFDAGSRIRETIVGIVAGMALGTDGVSADRPIIAFAEKDADSVKVSARATPDLVRRGVDLSEVMAEAATAVDGEGGGHDIAAGATIPAGAQETFIQAAEAILRDQLA